MQNKKIICDFCGEIIFLLTNNFNNFGNKNEINYYQVQMRKKEMYHIKCEKCKIGLVTFNDIKKREIQPIKICLKKPYVEIKVKIFKNMIEILNSEQDYI